MAIARLQFALGLLSFETVFLLALTRGGSFTEAEDRSSLETEFYIANLAAQISGAVLVRLYGNGLYYNGETGEFEGQVTNFEIVNAGQVISVLLPYATAVATLQHAMLSGLAVPIATTDDPPKAAVTEALPANVTWETHPEYFDLILPPESGYGMQFTGSDGADVINTYVTNDQIAGGLGDDTVVMSPGTDIIDGGDDTDTADGRLLDSGMTFDGAAGSGESGADSFTLTDVEVLIGTEFGDTLTAGAVLRTLYGEGGNDTLRGDAGGDALNGGAGNDTMRGFGGDDTLSGDAGRNLYDGGGGTDTADYSEATGRVIVDLQTDISGQGYLRFFDGGAAQGDVLSGIENLTGGVFADNLRGDSGDNLLVGGAVSDRLYGRAGDDTLLGGAGADALYGNLGADVMTGGSDEGRRDRYIYFHAEESRAGAGNRDVITDYAAGEDRIELGRIDADISQGFKQEFTFIGGTAFSGTAGELGYRHEGGNTIVQADRDGDGAADFEIELTGVMELTTDDFLL